MTLEKILKTPYGKIVEFLLENPVLDFSKSEIAEEADISRTTLYNWWDQIEEQNIVEKTRKYQNTQLYRLNANSEIVNKLTELKIELEENQQSHKDAKTKAKA